mmetsp:Transcript_11011/g.23750  ORF Transcript_11011/g.23750 Transcript_11011/m.23750 type:complete len:205 (-) Transcript_11011:1267-1881(-)
MPLLGKVTPSVPCAPSAPCWTVVESIGLGIWSKVVPATSMCRLGAALWRLEAGRVILLLLLDGWQCDGVGLTECRGSSQGDHTTPSAALSTLCSSAVPTITDDDAGRYRGDRQLDRGALTATRAAPLAGCQLPQLATAGRRRCAALAAGQQARLGQLAAASATTAGTADAGLFYRRLLGYDRHARNVWNDTHHRAQSCSHQAPP